jgi:hypothetical protein
MANVHWILQGKGGVGKTLVASTLAQYHRNIGNESCGVDTDPVNASFHEYKALDVSRLELLENGVVNPRRFDSLLDSIISEDHDFIIDNGASSFIALSAYLVENNAIELLVEAGKGVIVHVPITGGQAMADTLTGLDSLLRNFHPGAQFVIWENRFFGPVEYDGTPFEKGGMYRKYKDRILGIIKIEQRSPQTFGEDIRLMLSQKMTFNEAIKSDAFPLMAKQRLKTVRDSIFSQLKVLPL